MTPICLAAYTQHTTTTHLSTAQPYGQYVVPVAAQCVSVSASRYMKYALYGCKYGGGNDRLSNHTKLCSYSAAPHPQQLPYFHIPFTSPPHFPHLFPHFFPPPPPPSSVCLLTHSANSANLPNPSLGITSINTLRPTNQIEEIRYNRYISHPFYLPLLPGSSDVSMDRTFCRKAVFQGNRAHPGDSLPHHLLRRLQAILSEVWRRCGTAHRRFSVVFFSKQSGCFTDWLID